MARRARAMIMHVTPESMTVFPAKPDSTRQGQHINIEGDRTAHLLTELNRIERHQRKRGGSSSAPTIGVPVRTALDIAMACRPLRVL